MKPQNKCHFYSLGIATVVPKDYKYFWWVNCFWELGSLPSNVHFLSSPSHLGFLPSGFDGMAWQWRLWQASPAFAVINQIIGTVEVTNTDGWWTPKTVKKLDGWWFLPRTKTCCMSEMVYGIGGGNPSISFFSAWKRGQVLKYCLHP